MRETSVAADHRAALGDFFEQGVEWIGMLVDIPGNLDDGELLAKLVRGFIDRLRDGGGAQLRASAPEIARAIGVVWGEGLRSRVGWVWCLLDDGLAMVSPDRAYAVFPSDYVARLLVPGADNTALLLSNMIAAGRLPPSRAGALIVIG